VDIILSPVKDETGIICVWENGSSPTRLRFIKREANCPSGCGLESENRNSRHRNFKNDFRKVKCLCNSIHWMTDTVSVWIIRFNQRAKGTEWMGYCPNRGRFILMVNINAFRKMLFQ
jgi:hypothetical protein